MHPRFCASCSARHQGGQGRQPDHAASMPTLKPPGLLTCMWRALMSPTDSSLLGPHPGHCERGLGGPGLPGGQVQRSWGGGGLAQKHQRIAAPAGFHLIRVFAIFSSKSRAVCASPSRPPRTFCLAPASPCLARPGVARPCDIGTACLCSAPPSPKTRHFYTGRWGTQGKALGQGPETGAWA